MRTPAAIRRANRIMIEAELKTYSARKGQLQETIEYIAWSSQRIDGPRDPYAVSDPTVRKAAELEESCDELSRRVYAVEYAMQHFKRGCDPLRWEAMQLRYFSNSFSPQQVADRLYISLRTFHYWRRQFVELVAQALGWDI